jgi:preprotein translocase subunit SecB
MSSGEKTIAPPQLRVVAQYIKDLSFESQTPRSLIPVSQQPKMRIQANIEASQLSVTDIEVTLKIEAKGESDGNVLFILELAYAGTFRISNVPPEGMDAIIEIECPRVLFPFAREIVAKMMDNGGFPPLLLDPIDFVQLYRERMGRMPATGQQPH